MTVAGILTAAADRAEAQPTVRKAIAAGWSALHADRELISEAFRAWARAEDYSGDIPALGGVLDRRYRKATAADVAGSLRRAAAG